MKSIKFLAALAIPAMFAACTNEEIVSETPQQLNKVVGAELIGTDVSIKLDGVDSRLNSEGWQSTDKLGVAWIVNGKYDSEQDINNTPDNNKWVANHMFVAEEGKLVTKGNIYKGWHFAYFPFQYTETISEQDFVINPAQTSKVWAGGRINDALHISTLKFLTKQSLDENYQIKPEVGLAPQRVVNAIRVTTNYLGEFAEGKAYAGLGVNSVTLKVNAGYNVFASTVTMNVKNLPQDIDPENPVTEEAFQNSMYKGGANAVLIKKGASNTITTDVSEAGFVTGEVGSLYTLTISESSDALTNGGIEIQVNVDGGYFLVKYTDKAEDLLSESEKKNNDAINALREAYATGGAMTEVGKNLVLDVDLYNDIFEVDFLNINSLEEWNEAVTMAETLGRTEVVFGVGSTIDFNAGEIQMPNNCTVTVQSSETLLGVAALKISKNMAAWPEKLTSNVPVIVASNVTVSDATGINGSNIKVEQNGRLILPKNKTISSPIHNDGIISLRAGAQLTSANNDNEHGRIAIAYGAKVTTAASKEGVIAYGIDKEEKAYKINNLINGTFGVKVNTLVVGTEVELDLNLADAGVPAGSDPYNPSAQVQGIKLNYLTGVNIEMKGGTITKGKGSNNEVGTIQVKSGENKIAVEKLVGDIIVEAGSLDMEISELEGDLTNKGVITLNSEKTIKINNIVNNGGELTSNNDIEVNNITLMNKSVTTLGEEWDKTIWYIGNYVHSNSSVNGYVNKFTAGGITVSELTSAISAVEEGGVVKLSGDITLASPADLASSKAYTLNLNGYKLNLATLPNTPINTKLNIVNGTVASQLYTQGVLTAENVTFEINSKISSTEGAIQLRGNNNATFKNCTFKVKDGMSALVTEHLGFGGVLTLDGCTFKKSNKSIFINPLNTNPSAKVIVTNSVFEDDFTCEFYNEEDQFIIIGNTFNGLFGVADGCSTISGMSTESKIFCNELLDNNEFKGANKIVVGWPIDGYINNKF